MNPFGLLLISVGLLMMVIGFKGSQHSVMNAFKGIHGGASSSNSGSTGSQGSTNGNGTIVGGGPGGTTMGTV